MNLASETAGLVSQNRLTKDLDLDESCHINEEEHLKTDCAVVNDSDAPVDESPDKRAWVSPLDDYNGGLYGSENSNKEEDQTPEFDVDNCCDAYIDISPDS